MYDINDIVYTVLNSYEQECNMQRRIRRVARDTLSNGFITVQAREGPSIIMKDQIAGLFYAPTDADPNVKYMEPEDE
jgi:hypothetical protein